MYMYMTVFVDNVPINTDFDKSNSRGGDSYMEQTGMLVGNFELNP